MTRSIACNAPVLLTVWVLSVFLIGGGAARAEDAKALSPHVIERFGEPPAVPDGPLAEEVRIAVQSAFIDSMVNSTWGTEQTVAILVISQSKDPRLVWLISDMLRFVPQPALNSLLVDAAGELLGKELSTQNAWGVVTDHLIAWDIPAPPNYLEAKRAIFTSAIPGWDRIFVEGDIDWRHVSWGGVLIDDRAYDTTDEPCNCIPAADNPEVSSAEDATWLKDEDIVFGVEVNGEYRAYPRRIMEVREMVNDTLGGRDLGIPYCTLCGAAQAYFTDQLPDGVARPILRTSGLLIRSNKVMYDVETYSVFDTFLGKAVTGPLAEKGVQLEQASVSPPTGEPGRRRIPRPRSWSRRWRWAAISTSATAAMPMGRSSRSAMSTRGFPCMRTLSAPSPTAAGRSRSSAVRLWSRCATVNRWRSRMSGWRSVPAASRRWTRTAATSAATRRSGSPGRSSTPTRRSGRNNRRANTAAPSGWRMGWDSNPRGP